MFPFFIDDLNKKVDETQPIVFPYKVGDFLQLTPKGEAHLTNKHWYGPNVATDHEILKKIKSYYGVLVLKQFYRQSENQSHFSFLKGLVFEFVENFIEFEELPGIMLPETMFKVITKQEYNRQRGLCPSCASPGEWIALTLQCKKHGIFM